MIDFLIEYYNKLIQNKNLKTEEILNQLFYILFFNTFYINSNRQKIVLINPQNINLVKKYYFKTLNTIKENFEKNKQSNKFNSNTWKNIFYEFKSIIDENNKSNKYSLISNILFEKEFFAFYNKLSNYKLNDFSDFLNNLFSVFINYLQRNFMILNKPNIDYKDYFENLN